jgi:flagellar biosynthesis component FlhA
VQANPEDVEDSRLEAVRDAVWSAFAAVPVDTTRPIVTTTGARHAIRELLAPEFPDLPVLAYSELSPEVELFLEDEISSRVRT